jgi:hypothetical protein
LYRYGEFNDTMAKRDAAIASAKEEMAQLKVGRCTLAPPS